MSTDLIAMGLFAIAGAIYLARCAFWPYGPCWWCQRRRGRSAGSSAQMWGRCAVCKGDGERLRPGARLLLRLHIPVPGLGRRK